MQARAPQAAPWVWPGTAAARCLGFGGGRTGAGASPAAQGIPEQGSGIDGVPHRDASSKNTAGGRAGSCHPPQGWPAPAVPAPGGKAQALPGTPVPSSPNSRQLTELLGSHSDWNKT